MSILKLVKATKNDLRMTVAHEQYLATHSDVQLNDEIVEFIRKEVQTPQRERRFTFSASSLGSCPRAQVLKYIGHPGDNKVSSDLASIFIHGTWTHLKWQAMGMDAGWLKGTEVSCRLDEYNATGTIDGLLSDDCGWELKSINSNGFRVVCESGPQPKHLLQVHFYMLATGIRTWSLVYEDKNTQQWREFVVPYDDKVGESVVEELTLLNQAVTYKELPVMYDSCERREGNAFKQCQFRETCATAGLWPRKGIKINV